MHSFHHSRGRILFDVFCALAVSASLAGGWLQTGASALLAGSAVAALYGLVHLFDVRQARPIVAAGAGQEALGTEPPAHVAAVEAVPSHQSLATVVEEPPIVEPAAPAKARAPRKGRARASGGKSAKVVQIAPPGKADAVDVAPTEDAGIERLVPAEDLHPHISPLFEPEPFARMPRRAFGRKSG